MPRDYAKYRSQPEQKIVEKGWLKRLIILIVGMGIVSILMVGIYLYKQNAGQSFSQKMSHWTAEMRARFSHKKTSIAAVSNKTPSVMQAKEEPQVRFNFYTELPKMQVTIPDDEQNPTSQATARQNIPAASTKMASLPPAEPKKEVNTGQYIVQLGEFKNETEAGQMRVSLLLAGFEADTVTTSEDGNKTVTYRIQKGPFETISKAKEMQKKLQKKGIMGTIKQL